MGTKLSCYVSYIIIYNEKKYLIELCLNTAVSMFCTERSLQDTTAPLRPLCPPITHVSPWSI